MSSSKAAPARGLRPCVRPRKNLSSASKFSPSTRTRSPGVELGASKGRKTSDSAAARQLSPSRPPRRAGDEVGPKPVGQQRIPLGALNVLKLGQVMFVTGTADFRH